MDSLDQSLRKFLSREDPRRVFVIKGDWGSGKTYFWNQFINQIPKELIPNGARYASVFGASTIDELSGLLAANVEYHSENSNNGQKFGQLIKKAAQLADAVDIPYVGNLSPLQKHIENSLLRNSVICIDDIERTNISADLILGFVTRLKDELGSKVVLLLNEGRLTKSGKDSLDLYREKVIDAEFSFSPSITDCIKIVWGDNPPEDVIEVFEAAKLSNIRIMAKTKWLRDYLETGLSEQSDPLKYHLLHNATKLAAVYYDQSNSINISEILDYNPYSGVYGIEDDEDDDSENKIDVEILKKLNYRPHDLDIFAIELLKNGHLDFEQYTSQLSASEKESEKLIAEHEHGEIWKRYRENFVYKEEAFVSDLCKLLKEKHTLLKTGEVFWSVDYLKRFGSTEDFTEITSQAVDRYMDERTNDRLHDFRMFHSDCPKNVLEMIKERISSRHEDTPLSELFYEMAEGRQLDDQKFERLSCFSADDFYELLINSEAKNLFEKVSIFGQSLQLSEGKGKTIKKNLKEALARIASGSEMDKCRIEKLIDRME
ncbi:MAG: P-loop NTPase fold protein [Verrucomicrobiota bacterium]